MFIPNRLRLAIIFIAGVSIFIIIIIYQYVFNNNSRIEISPVYISLCPYKSTIIHNQIIFNHDKSYVIHHYPEFICPQNFRNLADWVYGWPWNAFKEEIEYSTNTDRLIASNLPHGSIIYVKTDSLPLFFSTIYPYFSNQFVLITGQSDFVVPSQHLDYLERSDSKIIHWFGQNGDIDASRSEKFTHLPIGINCFEMAESIRGIHRQYSNNVLPSVVTTRTDEPIHYIQTFDITQRILNMTNKSDRLLLLNFLPDTDRTGLRKKIWQSICVNNENPLAICFNKPGGVDISTLPTIYKRNRQYPLWLSPRGNGLDCHRTWEALYLDAIPIVWHSTLDSIYTDLPVIIINDWNEITEEFLRTKLHEIALKKVQQPPVYQYEKLRIAFWRQMIFKKSRHSLINTATHNNQCWRAKTIQ